MNVMIYGNLQAQSLLQSFFEAVREQGVSHPFLIVRGPEHCGKMTCILDHVLSLIHPYESDFLLVADCSDELGKDHIIKIEKPKKKEDQYIKRSDGTIYEDIGMRELQEWYQKSPLGMYKIIVIEHIERMNASAANALLKTLEEPGVNHLIVATAKEYDRILPTIRSRGVVISWNLVSDQDIRMMIQDQGFSSIDQDVIVSYAQGAPGRGLWALQHIDIVRLLIKHAHDLRLSIISPEIVSFVQQTKQLVKDGQLLSVIDFMLYQELRHDHPHHAVIDLISIYKTYQHVQLNQEHLLLYALLQSMKSISGG